MARIQVLDRRVAELIAAGEVVERPASAMKEMVENSIDAGASAITVEIQNGGVRYLRVTDNGCGIPAEELPLAFLRHATSKIRSAADLETILTLGFRGEALASISAVARIEVLSRPADAEFGCRLVIEGGETLANEPVGCPIGTTIIVRDLFYNTPARQKFLKKDAAEGNAVSAILERVALSHPEISFKLIREGKQTLLTPGDNLLSSAIFSVLGREFFAGLLPVQGETDGVRVNGFVSRPTFSRPNRNGQIFFLNGRYVRSVTMMAALEEAFKGSIMVGKHPSCVLQVEIDPRMVDVNVHPAKTEVKFSDEKPVFHGIYYAVKSAIQEEDKPKSVKLPTATLTANEAVKQQSLFSASLPFAPQPNHSTGTVSTGKTLPLSDRGAMYESTLHRKTVQSTQWRSWVPPTSASPTETLEQLSEKLKERESQTLTSTGYQATPFGAVESSKEGPASVQSGADKRTISSKTRGEAEASITQTGPITQSECVSAPNVTFTGGDLQEAAPFLLVGEAFRTYLIAQLGDRLLFVDKHAAHERILYEKIRASHHQEAQMLLSPMQVGLTTEEYGALIPKLTELQEAGFFLEDYGDCTVLVRGLPMDLEAADGADLVREMAGKLLEKRQDITPDFLDWLYHSVACRSAIKAGDHTSTQELEALLRRILEGGDVRYCPHGRPVLMELTRRELEKQFGRIQ